jgi:hypothetical protein
MPGNKIQSVLKQTKSTFINNIVSIVLVQLEIRAGGSRENRPRNNWISDLVWVP